MRALVFVNPSSGHGGHDELVAAATSRGLDVHVLAEGDDAQALARAADVDALGMAGGDGSLAPIAEVALEREVPFACIPFGTRNHFARDLGLDRRDPIVALDAFTDGEERLIDVGRANERLFLNNVSLGIYAQLVHRREAHRRRRDAFARLRALSMFATHRELPRITVDGAPVHARIVLVANNAYDLDLLSIGRRERLDEGLLHLYVAASVVGTEWQARAGEGFTIDAAGERIDAAVDGEPDSLAAPIEFCIEPRALRVLVPRRPQRQDLVEGRKR